MRILMTVTPKESQQFLTEGARQVITLPKHLKYEPTQILYVKRKRDWLDACVFGYQDILAIQPTLDMHTILLLGPFTQPEFTIPVVQLEKPCKEKSCELCNFLSVIEGKRLCMNRVMNAPKPWCYVK